MKRLFFGLASILVMHNANAMLSNGSQKIAKKLLSQTSKKGVVTTSGHSNFFSSNAGDKKSNKDNNQLIDVFLKEKNQKLDSLQKDLEVLQSGKQVNKRGSIGVFSLGAGFELIDLGVTKFCDLSIDQKFSLAYVGAIGCSLMVMAPLLYLQGRYEVANDTKEIERKIVNILEQKELLEKLKQNVDESK